MSRIAAIAFNPAAAPTTTTVRGAVAADYQDCVLLFRELNDAPVLTRSSWLREILPTSLVVEADGQLVGHVFMQPLGETVFISHLVVTSSARRRGIGRGLLQTAARVARRAGFSTWALNVDAANAPAIRLYESLGLVYAYDSVMLQIEWTRALDCDRPALTARTIVPEDDAHVGAELAILPGLFAVARSRPDAVLTMMQDSSGRVVAAAVFGPAGFPALHPFRVAKTAPIASAFALLAALHPHAAPASALTTIVVEGHPELTTALLAAGGVTRVRMEHYRGDLNTLRIR